MPVQLNTSKRLYLKTKRLPLPALVHTLYYANEHHDIDILHVCKNR